VSYPGTGIAGDDGLAGQLQHFLYFVSMLVQPILGIQQEGF
jgi:hypothetical protein